MNIEEKKPGRLRFSRPARLLGHFHACGSDRGTRAVITLIGNPSSRRCGRSATKVTVVIESFTTDVKVIARAAAIWRKIEPNRNDIAVKGLANLKRAFRK